MLRRTVCLAAGLWLAMAAAASAAEPVKFTVTSDNRGQPGFVSILEQVRKVAGGPGLFILSVGDLDPVRVTRGQIDAVFGKSFAWYPVVGNHELDNPAGDPAAGNMAYLREYFNTNLKGKVNPGPEGTRETTYSFDAGDIHIAIINEYWDGKTEPGSDASGGGDVVDPLRAWLKTDLQASHKPWKLVVGHEPAYPQPDKDWGAARHAEDDLTGHPADRDAFWSLLEECRVAAYLCGHTHRYSRYQPPHSKVWQIDVGQARGNEDWKYDTFVIATADAKGLKFETYRNLIEPGKFALTDRLALPAAAAPAPAALPPAAK